MGAQIPTYKEIIKKMQSNTKDDIVLVEKAYAFAKKAHAGQKRYSGEPYFLHVATVALYLAEMDMDAQTIAAGVLHDAVEDVDGIETEDIENEFGVEVSHLVYGVTKLGTVRYHGVERHAESLRKLFAATAQDARVIIIKIMDRLHNARTLEHVPKAKRRRIALETLEVYAPIADRLGMSVAKKELEDAAFPYAYPKKYEEIYPLFKERYEQAQTRLTKMTKALKKELAANNITKFRTETRVKGVYSLHKKLERKKNQIEKIHDILALRIIVHTMPECYQVLGIIHNKWSPIPGKLKDYIACEKPNGYQSIHTTIVTNDGGTIEIQIRTEEMHREAQYGIASHLSYKEQSNKTGTIGAGLSWIQQFFPARLIGQELPQKKSAEKTQQSYSPNSAPDWIKTVADARKNGNPDEFIDELKNDFFTHRIFAFTPKGDAIDLPINATPIDFAFSIHSDVGTHMASAKINGKMCSFDTQLQNGDIVEIITKPSAKPSAKWLDHAVTSMAKRHIRNQIQGKIKTS